MRGNAVTPTPEPYVKPKREARALNEDAAEMMGQDEGEERVQEQA